MGNVEIAPAVGSAASAGSEESGVGQGEGQRWSSHLDLDRAGTWKRAVWLCGSELTGGWETDRRRRLGTVPQLGPGLLPFLTGRWREKNYDLVAPERKKEKEKIHSSFTRLF